MAFSDESLPDPVFSINSRELDESLAIEFSEKVIDMSSKEKLTIIEAFAELCQRESIEADDAVALMTPKLRLLVEIEATDLNLIKNSKKQKTERLF